MSLEESLAKALKGLLPVDQEKLSEAYSYFKRERDGILKRHPIEALHGQVMIVGYGNDGVLGSLYARRASDALRMIREGGFQGHVIMYRFSRAGGEGTIEYASCPAPADPNVETAVITCLDLKPA